MPGPCLLKTPLADDLLRLQSCVWRESLSDLGEAKLVLLSEKKDIAPDDLLGKPVTVTLAYRDDAKRPLNGYVTRFVQGGFEGKYFVYEMTVRPWFWLLTRTADCRIFQDMTVPDIVKSVFQDHPVARFEEKLFRSYRPWTYCVQYRETDFNFVARLLEQEGIYWFFEHAEGEHKLVLCDSASAHDAAPGCESLPFYGNVGQAPPELECINQWSLVRAVQPGKVVITDYDFERPSTSLEANQTRTRSYDLSDGEVFDYPGGYIQTSDGSQYAEDRLDEIQTAFETFTGGTNAQGVRTGCLLSLSRHPRDDQNAQYLVTATQMHMQQPVHEASDVQATLQCGFGAIPAAQQYRPARRTPKPQVAGPQTATVTGPSGEEIFTDKYGRVKVQFHWDRRGQKDENSSCWVRVSQPWAGKGWGGVSIPRIGQEVIVGFLEGDSDQPLIIGRLYNAEQMPPFPLPEGAVVSGIKSKSHKATGYNELSMDDTAGKEQVTIHAQYDMGTTVEHDQTSTVHNNRTDTIDVDDTESVGNNQTQSVGNNHQQSVKVNQTITVGGKQDLTVTGDRNKTVQSNENLNVTVNQQETIGGTRTLAVTGSDTQTFSNTQTVNVALMKTETIGAVYALSVVGAMNHAVGAALMQEVGGAKIVGVGAISAEKVGISKSISAGTNMTFDAGAKMAHKAGGSYAASAGSTMSMESGGDYSVNSKAKAAVEAASELVLKCGSAQLILKSGGDIELKGSGISINGSGKIVINAGGSLDLKGSPINQNS
jgi:type VI secretion system secreted protein VgrG